MDFVQRKTVDSAVDHFLKEAAEKEFPLVWDRYEGSLPQYGFCETGLNCRDCLQGPCISHPFQNQNKVGICGKDQEMVSIARELLKKDVLCFSEGCASVGLAKFGLLNPKQRDAVCGKGLLVPLSSLGKNVPAVVDLGSCENSGVTELHVVTQKMDHPEKVKLFLKEFERT